MDRDGRLLHIVEKATPNAFWVDERYRYGAFSQPHRDSMRDRWGVDIEVGTNILDSVHDPDDRATLQGLLDRALAGATVVEVAVRDEGTPDERRLEVTYTPMPGPAGDVAGVFASSRDTTANGRAETELWRRERQLAHSQQLARMGYWYAALDHGVIHLSDGALALVGLGTDGGAFPMQELTAILLRGVHPEDRDKAQVLIEDRTGPEPREFEFRFVLETGEIRHLRGRAEVVTDDDGRKGVLGVFQDDTELWRISERVRFDEQRLLRAEQLAGFGHWSVDPASGETQWSPGFFDILGLDPAAITANASLYLEMIHPDDLEAAMEHAARVTTTGERLDVTHRIVRPDGEVRLVRMQSETQRDETGEMRLHFGTALDVTGQRRAEEELASANGRLHRALSAAKAGTWEWDAPAGDANWSPELLSLYDLEPGLTREDVSWEDLIHPSDREATVAGFADAARSGTEMLRDWRVNTRDGSVRWVRSRAMPELDADGNVVRYVGVDIDVTESKAAQEEVDRLNRQLAGRVSELAATNEHLNELLYSLAHDLRSPLRAIDGFSLAFAEDHVDSTDERGAEQIGRVRAAAKRLGMLFDAALELANVRRGEVTLREVDLSALARSLVEELQELDPERETVVAVADDLTAVTDEDLARTVLEQLLANAWDATSSRAPGHIEVGATMAEGERRYFVRDDGVGFDQSYATKVFGSYQQLHPPHAGSGAGVGLTMVRHATGRLGGRCWAEAEQDRGATFWFTLGSGPGDAGVDDAT